VKGVEVGEFAVKVGEHVVDLCEPRVKDVDADEDKDAVEVENLRTRHAVINRRTPFLNYAALRCDGASATIDTGAVTSKAARTRERRGAGTRPLLALFCAGSSRMVHPSSTSIVLVRHRHGYAVNFHHGLLVQPSKTPPGVPHPHARSQA
jgi:hypothetical protein